MESAASAGPLPRAARNYALVVLFCAYTCNIFDRNILTILLEPIRGEFGLSDTQLGLLTGICFALVYSLAGLPAGMLADRVSRRWLVAACLSWWSLATFGCGLAKNFLQLLLGRMSVGLGEGGGAPAALSMIADLFPAGRRATAMSIYYLSAPIGTASALVVGSWIAAAHGWRAAFYVSALPGLAIAALCLSVREPRRGAYESAIAAPPAPAATLGDTLSCLWKQRSLFHCIVGTTINVLVISGVGTWIASLLIRERHLDIRPVGAFIAGCYVIFGILGTATGGLLTDSLSVRDVRWKFWTIAVGLLVTVPSITGVVLAPNVPAAATCYCCYVFASSLWYGPTYGICQSLARPEMRGTLSAVLYLVTNLIGYGFGSQLVGLLSDAFAAKLPGRSLGAAIITVAALNLWGAWHFHRGSQTLQKDLQLSGAI